MNRACSSATFCQEHSKRIKMETFLKMETPNLKSLTQDVRLVQLLTQTLWFLPQSKPNAKRFEVHHNLLWLLRFFRTPYALFSSNSLSFLSYQAELPYEERLCKQKNRCIWNKVSDKSTRHLCAVTRIQRLFWVLKSISYVSFSAWYDINLQSIDKLEKWLIHDVQHTVPVKWHLQQKIADLYQMRVTKDVNQYQETGKNSNEREH